MAFRRSFRRSRRRRPMRRSRRVRRVSGFKRKSAAFTDYMGNMTTFGFASRKVRPRVWRRKLWNDTLSENHYRSIFTQTQTQATDTTNTGGTLTMYLPTMSAIGSSNLGFWEQGVVNTDEGVAAPTVWSGDIILRGGKITCQIFNPSSTDSVGFKVWIVKTIKNPDLNLFPSLSVLPREFDPSCIPDFARKIGKVLHSREGTVRVLSSASVEYRERIRKIDQASYRIAGTPNNTLVGGDQLTFLVLLYNLSTTTANNVVVSTSCNLSFSADALT